MCKQKMTFFLKTVQVWYNHTLIHLFKYCLMDVIKKKMEEEGEYK